MDKRENQEKYPAILREILKLARNSAIGKSAHFHASDRNKNLNTLLNLPVLIINVFLGSVLFFSLSQTIPTYTKWIGGLLGFFAASLTIFQAFFKFSNNASSHKRVANLFMAVEREAVFQIRAYEDGIVNLKTIYEKTNELQQRYFSICEEAEDLTTIKKDFSYAQDKVKNWKGIGRFAFFAKDKRKEPFYHSHGVRDENNGSN